MGNESAAFDRASFERWRSRSAGNAGAFEEVAATWRLPLPLEAARDRGAIRPAERRELRRFAAAIAAMFLTVTAVAVFEHRNSPSGRANSPLALRDLEGGRGVSRAFKLADGSVVTLGSSAHLRLAYSATERRLTLASGQARFDVAHDGQRPFRVFAGASVVTAHGTMFDVGIEPGGVVVSLLRGSVEVTRNKSSAPVESRRLKPGQRVRVPVDGPIGQVSNVAERGMLDFDRKQVSEAVVAFNARNAVRIVVDQAAGSNTITGGFRADDPQGFARILATMFDLHLAGVGTERLELTAKR
jgi:transmembrane sensor